MLQRGQAAAACARRTGCGIDEAGEIVREQETRSASVARATGPEAEREGQSAGVSRRAALGGAGAAALGLAVPAWLAEPAAAAAAPGSGHQPRVVVIGSGMAGLGCAHRLWHRHGIRSEVYEYNATRPGGRVYTLRGFFDGGQTAEQHGEFISSEHTQMRLLTKAFGLHLDNVNHYPPHTHPQQQRMRFNGRFWSQAALDKEWQDYAYELFRVAANRKAPWPTTYRHSTHWARHWDHLSAAEWIERNIRGGLRSDFGQLCVSTLLDEYGGPVDEQSALNLIYLLGFYDSSESGLQPRKHPELSGTDEKWHIRGGNDQLVSDLVRRLPGGTLRLGHQLVALRARGHGRYTCVFAHGRGVREVVADHVVLTLPFTKLREVELHGIQLPARQLRAIRHEPLSTNSKIQLQFRRRVWNADGWTGDYYSDQLSQSGWETTIDQPGEAGILVTLPGGHTGADIGRRYGLRSYYGRAPHAMVADYLADIETNFPGARAAFNGRAFYAWSNGDPHIGGAYSYFKVGQYTAFNGSQARRHGNLHFGGEHTSLNFQGYMEGALRSGYRCADEIRS
jgi:monoamine oxidase